MAQQQNTGSCEIINTTIDPIFTNTANYDLAFYTSSSNQSIHFGTQVGGSGAPSALKVTKSNIEINGDIALTKTLAVNGLLIQKKATEGTLHNISATVTSVPALASGDSNVTLSLSAGQSNFRFVNSNNQEVAHINEYSIANFGTVHASSNDSQASPSYAWVNDNTTGMYHGASNAIGFTCAGSNVVSITPSGIIMQRRDYIRTGYARAGSGYGMTFTTLSNNALPGYIQYNVNATSGDSFTILKSGVYSIQMNLRKIESTNAIITLSSTRTLGALAQTQYTGNSAFSEVGIAFCGYIGQNEIVTPQAGNHLTSPINSVMASPAGDPNLIITLLYCVS